MGEVFKIVVTGPFNSGKTTFIGAISEIEVVSTERMTGGPSGDEAPTTVAMDFGRISLPHGSVLHLYGTPGQSRFDFMWEILSEGMLGYVVLMDGSDPSTLEEGQRIIEAFTDMCAAPFVVGLTRADRQECMDTGGMRKELARWGDVEVLRCDARRREDVKSVLLRLLQLVMERAEAAEPVG